MSTSSALGFRVKAHLFGAGKITSDQKLRAQIDNLTLQAKDLDTTGASLLRQADEFSKRASHTVAPGTKPPYRDSLFQRNKNALGPSQYEEQVNAYKTLTSDWKKHQSDVAEYGKRLNRFEVAVDALKEKHVKPDKVMGNTEHDLEGLENALFNLKGQRAKLNEKTATVKMPKSN